jgi:hypothetical protein
MSSAKAAKVVKKEESKQTLYDVDYAITLSGFTVIAADSPEAAKAIVEDSANLPTLFHASSAFNPASVLSLTPTVKPGETSDNLGAAIVAIPRVLNAVKK